MIMTLAIWIHAIISTVRHLAESRNQQCEQLHDCLNGYCPGPEVIKLFSSSAQLSLKFQILINTEITYIS